MNNPPQMIPVSTLAQTKLTKLGKLECVVAWTESGTGWIVARSRFIRSRDVLIEDSTEDNGFDTKWSENLKPGLYLLTIQPWSSDQDVHGECDSGIDVLHCTPLAFADLPGDPDPDDWHIQQYDRIRADHPQLPEWDDLSEDKKANIRAANERNRKFINDLGEAIRSGGTLPDPFAD